MLINDINETEYFKAMDETIICELLHPDNESEVNEMNFSIAHAFLEPEKSSLPHKITDSVEVYFVLEGEGCMHIDHEKETLKPGQAVYIPPNSCQWIENTGKTALKFLCIVSPPWNDDKEDLCL